ncbi:MAG: hypothetical protein LBL82_05540 [Oscillospiraceae bacterium]|jgi:DNA repair protein RadC|nr:hypothetical protein [Oscillospiraceae bacterium]
MHEGHRERLRNRYLKEGFDNFELHNVLELLLFYGVPRKDTNELAHNLIKHFGSFSEVLDAPVHELEKIDGLPHNAAVMLSMLPSVFRLYLNDKTGGKKISGIDDIREFIFNQFVGLTEERVIFVCIDNAMRMISSDTVASGSVNSANVNMRTLVDLAIRHNAVAVIIAHNHPRGVSLPSREDLKTTEKVNMVMHSIGVRLIDHVICSPSDYSALAEAEQFDYLFM